jgi:16S rRNA processing protein RimM
MNPKLNKYFDKSALVLLGQIAAFKGTKGDVVLMPDVPDYEINETEPVLVETDGYLVPFFIEEDSVIYSKNGEISLKFDTVNSNAEAAKLSGKKVYVLKEDLITNSEDDYDEGDFKYLNYSCYDQNGTLLGKIVDIDDIPGNPLLIIHDSYGKEVLVPVNAAEILEENDIIQTVKITIPDGLLEI